MCLHTETTFGLNEQIDKTSVTVIIQRAEHNFKVVIQAVSGGCYFSDVLFAYWYFLMFW